jgi:putative multiple sugar transport system substrate-binding protein
MKKILVILMTLSIIFASISGCGKRPQSTSFVGVSFAEEDRDSKAAAERFKQSESYRYTVDVRYSKNSWSQQKQDIEQLSNTEGCEILIIEPVADVKANELNLLLQAAKKKGISVISYNNLIMDTTEVDYYVGFDYVAVGASIANSLMKGLAVREESSSYNVEIFAGDVNVDEQADDVLYGAEQVLGEFINNKYKVLSGDTHSDDTAITDGSEIKAQAKMENTLSNYYSNGETLNGILSLGDAMSIGCLNAVQSAGYAKGSGRPLPITTGLGCTAASVKSILEGEQYSSVFLSPYALADMTINIANFIIYGGELRPYDNMVNNGMKDILAYYCDSIVITADNAEEELIKSGYYTLEYLGIKG